MSFARRRTPVGALRAFSGLLGGLMLLSPHQLRAAESAATRTSRVTRGAPLPALLRLYAFQLVPSPTLTIGTDGVKAGARWQLTPFVYSFGITERPARFFLVAPVARHVGAIESYLSPEWSCCIRSESGWLARAGLRVYWPVVGWGETLAMSLGGSYYYENHRQAGSAELGFYTFASMLGVTITGSPWLIGREMMLTLSLRYY